MTSMTYDDSTRSFLLRNEPMNVRRSPSSMGLLSEVFRRGKEVQRSLSPGHPVLAWGDRAAWFVEDHDKQPHSFGPGTPFGRLLEADGKVLCVDTEFESITFTHFAEDRVHRKLPFAFYDPEPLTGVVIDEEKVERKVPVYTISDAAREHRREDRLIETMKREKLLHRSRIGNTRLLLVECRPMIECVDRMMERGQSFFATP